MSQLGGGGGTAVGGGEELGCMLGGAGEGVEHAAGVVGISGGAEAAEGVEGGGEGMAPMAAGRRTGSAI